jgi:YD repeat-containing protein
MAYDSAPGQVVLFGGVADQSFPNDTWVWGSGSPPATGTISVNTNLGAATFTISGPASYTGSGSPFSRTNAPTSTYTISFNVVPRYATPTSQIQTFGGGGTLTFNGTYTAVTVQPPAVNLGTPGAGTSRNGSVAEPVNTTTGNYYSTLTDLAVPGRGLSFVFTRNYNSQDTYSGPMGYAWTHSYNISLAVDGGTGVASIKQADGHQDFYNPGTGGTFTPQTRGLFNTLEKYGDNSFTLTFKNQTKYNFSPAGRLLTIADRNGNRQTLAYDGSGRLTSVTDPSGRVFTFTYDATSRLISLADPLARTLQYAYDASGNLISFRDALGALTQYAYDANHRMTSAIDALSNTYLLNTYDAQGRVITQKNARGFTTTLSLVVLLRRLATSRVNHVNRTFLLCSIRTLSFCRDNSIHVLDNGANVR